MIRRSTSGIGLYELLEQSLRELTTQELVCQVREMRQMMDNDPSDLDRSILNEELSSFIKELKSRGVVLECEDADHLLSGKFGE
jgi:hypothetical protein